MDKPKMILFDYGHTLAYEPRVDHIAGAEKVLALATSNPHAITAERLNQMGASLFDEQAKILRPNCMEVMGQRLDKLIYETMGLQFNLEPFELEYERWVAAEAIFPMEGIEELLIFLSEQGIRTGVISNLAYSGKVLERRIHDILPTNHFECILASSEYLYRKPSPHIFHVAMGKAQLKPQEIWFCGDDILCDVEGAHNTGMFPVWYDSAIPCTYKEQPYRQPNCDHIHIHEWRELIKILQKLR